MRLMRRFAVSVGTLGLVALGLVAAVAGTSAALGAGTGTALATTANPPGAATLASAVPSTAIPRGRVTFAVSCSSTRATAATLFGRALGLTPQIQMRPSLAAGHFTVSVILPAKIRAGTYHPSIGCSDGTSATATVLIPPYGAAASAQLRDRTPGSSAGTWLAAGGLILIVAGVVAGGVTVRRRRRNAPAPERPDFIPPQGRPDHSADAGHSDRPDYSAHAGHAGHFDTRLLVFARAMSRQLLGLGAAADIADHRADPRHRVGLRRLSALS